MLSKLKLSYELGAAEVTDFLVDWVNDNDPDYVIKDVVQWTKDKGLGKKSFNSFRGLMLDHLDFDILLKKGEITLEDRNRYESWSTNVESIYNFSSKKDFGLILSRRVRPSDDYINVVELTKHLLEEEGVHPVSLSEGDFPVLDNWEECEIIIPPVCTKCKIGDTIECLYMKNSKDLILLGNKFKEYGWNVTRASLDLLFGEDMLYITFDKMGEAKVHGNIHSASDYFKLRTDLSCDSPV